MKKILIGGPEHGVVGRILKYAVLIFTKKHTQPIPTSSYKKATVAFIVTKSMRNELSNLGWKKSQVDSMTPQKAWDLIKSNCSPNTSNKPPAALPPIA